MIGWVSVAGVMASGCAAIGCAAICATTWATARFGQRVNAPVQDVVVEPVSILKPLYGAEPRLAENLATFITQRWAAPIQLVGGVQRADDRALPAAQSLGDNIDIVIDPQRHGANAKIGNLINMVPTARHRLLVLSDSDIAAPPDYMRRVVAALNQPGVGAVTCVYAGRGDAGFWSVMSAAMLSYHFLPGVLLSAMLGAGDACMGSTIALRRETLDAIGGFERFADILADDHAIGQAVRDLGMSVAIAPVVVTHASTEGSFVALTAHELRWAATVRDLRPAGHIGSTLLHPLPFALIGFAIEQSLVSGGLVLAALVIRQLSVGVIDRIVGRSTAPRWLMPLRDLLSFGIHIASLTVRHVDWRGAKLTIRQAGRIEV